MDCVNEETMRRIFAQSEDVLKLTMTHIIAVTANQGDEQGLATIDRLFHERLEELGPDFDDPFEQLVYDQFSRSAPIDNDTIRQYQQR